MKKACLLLFITISCLCSFADHTKGGWMYYEYIGAGNTPGTAKYRIGMYMFVICGTNSSQINQTLFLSVYTGINEDQFYKHIPLLLNTESNISNCDTCDYCITNKPLLCYKYLQYETETDLPISSTGYIMGYQLCCRLSGIRNIVNSNTLGDTWTIKIPGTNNGSTAPENTSPTFQSNDTALICADNYFIFDFEAQDRDRDTLRYSFVPAYKGGIGISPIYAVPPYISVPYTSPFSATLPLGTNVTIDPVTGRISGIAPTYTGDYLVTVAVKEYRNEIYIGETRKSLHVFVASCTILDAYLANDFKCEGLTKSFNNLVTSPPGSTYLWDFGVPGTTTDVSNSFSPVYTFPDTGTYKVSLKISLDNCVDSSFAYVKVYPTLYHDFSFSEPCNNSPIQFSDNTATALGIANSWTWNFGDTSSSSFNNSSMQNPQHIFKKTGFYNLDLTVSNKEGCISTVSKQIEIKENPSISISSDTLICSSDTLQLTIGTNGNISWTPAYNINDQNIGSPLVSPDVPTKYYVSVINPYGCKASDSVFVDVKSFVTIDAGRDTAICTGDVFQLNAVSDALYYNWFPGSPLNDPLIKNPVAFPVSTTKFYVTGNIGKCQSTDSIMVRVAQHPVITAIPDTTICLGNSVQLFSSGGSNYSWFPVFFLNDPKIANPVARPDRNMLYTVTIRDTLGCLVEVRDTVLVLVKRISVDAGPRDTAILINQPFQLNASGASTYSWSPATGLNNPSIANPVATISNDIDYVVTATVIPGCFAKDTISVKTYKILPGIYLPTAFTPNGDGSNDLLKPIAIGIKLINYFKIFNRWGTLIFSMENSSYKSGWDGTYNGKPQDTDVFVWVAEGIDYLDKKITQKGTVTLLR